MIGELMSLPMVRKVRKEKEYVNKMRKGKTLGMRWVHPIRSWKQ